MNKVKEAILIHLLKKKQEEMKERGKILFKEITSEKDLSVCPEKAINNFYRIQDYQKAINELLSFF